MQLDSPERLKTLITSRPFGGGTIWLRKLTNAERRRLVKAREEMVPSEDAEAEGIAWGALALSKQLCDADGKLVYDSDEWRAKLANDLTPDEMADLLTAAAEWSLRGGEQKKS